MRSLVRSAALWLAMMLPALAQTPTFTSIQAGNLGINVKGGPYNAKCDGITDDTAAIQAAINAGVSSGTAFTLLFPAGVCKTTAALTIVGGAGQNIAIKGESRAAAQLLVTGGGDGIDVTMNQAATIFSAMLDITDLTILATSSAGTAIKAIASVPNSVSPKFTNLRIGYLGGGSFANGISTALMSNIAVHNVNINSPNSTGTAFSLDGNATFPSITDIFSDIYFWGFATGILIGNGTTSYVQGVTITNAHLQQSTAACIVWKNNPVGFLGDMLLVSNSFCNGTIAISNVEDVVLEGNYILSGIVGAQVTITTASSAIISNNTFNANNTNGTNGLNISGSHAVVTSNNFLNYGGSPSAPIIFSAGSSDSLAIGNKCDACGTDNVVNDFGTNWHRDNINNGNLAATTDNIPTTHKAQEAWTWQVPGSPTFANAGTVMGWNYAGQGETDIFTSRQAGGAHGYSVIWYDTTAGTVGAQLLGLDIDGNVHLTGTLTGASVPVSVTGGLQLVTMVTVASLPTCNAGLKGTFRTVSDATSPAYNAALTGGGAVSVPVYCNGTAWLAH